MYDRQQRGIVIRDRFICEAKKWYLHDVVRVRRVVGGKAIGNDSAAFGVVTAEMSEFDLALVQVTHSALLIPMGDFRWQADAGLTTGMLSEELSIWIKQFFLFPNPLARHYPDYRLSCKIQILL